MTGPAVVVAMPWEAAGLAALGDRVAVSGPGAASAAAAARELVATGATALISWGVAAGLDPTLPPGALLLPRQVVARGGDRVRVDAAWHTHLCGALERLQPSVAPLAEAGVLLDRPEAKAALQRESQAVAADMESAAILRVAREAGLPGAVVRVVLDPAASGVPAAWAGVVTAAGGLSPGRLAAVLVRPGNWPAGLVLAGYRGRARRTLRAAAAAFTAIGRG